jgi:hypothetical protein
MTKYPDATLDLHEKVLEVCKQAGINKPVVPKQTNPVRKALGSTSPAEATGTSLAQLKALAMKGERPKDPAPLRDFIQRHKSLRDDVNLGPRKVAVVAIASTRS